MVVSRFFLSVGGGGLENISRPLGVGFKKSAPKAPIFLRRRRLGAKAPKIDPPLGEIFFGKNYSWKIF